LAIFNVVGSRDDMLCMDDVVVVPFESSSCSVSDEAADTCAPTLTHARIHEAYVLNNELLPLLKMKSIFMVSTSTRNGMVSDARLANVIE
jgi:hypothetical protein